MQEVAAQEEAFLVGMIRVEVTAGTIKKATIKKAMAATGTVTRREGEVTKSKNRHSSLRRGWQVRSSPLRMWKECSRYGVRTYSRKATEIATEQLQRKNYNRKNYSRNKDSGNAEGVTHV